MAATQSQQHGYFAWEQPHEPMEGGGIRRTPMLDPVEAEHNTMTDLETSLRLLRDDLDWLVSHLREEVDSLFPLTDQDDVIDYLTRMAYYRGAQMVALRVKRWQEEEFWN